MKTTPENVPFLARILAGATLALALALAGCQPAACPPVDSHPLHAYGMLGAGGWMIEGEGESARIMEAAYVRAGWVGCGEFEAVAAWEWVWVPAAATVNK